MTTPPTSPGWRVQEHLVGSVYRAPPGFTLEQVKDRSQWPEGFQLGPVQESKLKVGEILLVPCLTGGMYVGRVYATAEGDPYFRSMGGSLYGVLEWSRDDRQCWACGGLANIRELYK